ncbi:MAG: thiol:disulfide interchange protein DsbA/DsbL [Comamonadaceae bacterium]|nr:thiol:disulfide interchange protein DsbA/DsbL [Comamonadaceae bacterium]
MKRREFTLAATLPAWAGLLALPAAAQTANFVPKEGKDYKTLKQRAPVEGAQAGQVEVIEFFSYGCSHCKDFEPLFEKWKTAAPKNVFVQRVHVGFSKAFEPLQRIYYALEAMGAVDAVHMKVFTALQNERKRLDQENVLLPWIAEQGINREKFAAAYKSFGVASKVRRALQLQEDYQVEGTPALGIAGRYYTDPSLASGFERMLQTADVLIAKERKGA